MEITRTYIDQLTYNIIGAAIEVHKALGPGLLESVYVRCLLRELELRGLSFRTEVWVPLHYKGADLEINLKLDIIVEELVVLEIKSTEAILSIHTAQLHTYMRLIKAPKGILINFNCKNIFKEGQKTVVNELYANFPFD